VCPRRTNHRTLHVPDALPIRFPVRLNPAALSGDARTCRFRKRRTQKCLYCLDRAHTRQPRCNIFIYRHILFARFTAVVESLFSSFAQRKRGLFTIYLHYRRVFGEIFTTSDDNVESLLFYYMCPSRQRPK
jgi:hypothetical protein